jgi:hypothetical protein
LSSGSFGPRRRNESWFFGLKTVKEKVVAQRFTMSAPGRDAVSSGAGDLMASYSKPEKFCGVLGIICFLLFSYPLIHIFNYDTIVGGVPLLSLYILVVWMLAVIGLYAMSSRLAPADLKDTKEPKGHAE